MGRVQPQPIKPKGLTKIGSKNPLSPPPFLSFSTPHWLATTVKGCLRDIIPLDTNKSQQPSATLGLEVLGRVNPDIQGTLSF
jgi:hypothetical protein